MSGWIKLHRQIQQHWLWQDKPFDRRSAWIDLLLMANHTNTKILFNGELIEIDRGSRITSIRQLCDRWGWSNTKVKNFLLLLEKDGMITVNSDTKKTTINILNYSDYQDPSDTKNDTGATEERQNNDGGATEEHTNKNDKKNKNDKECKEDIYILTPDEQRFLDTLSQVKNYPLDRERDIEMYKTMKERYPELDLNEAIEQWQAYKLDQPLKPNSNPRSQINTSFRNSVRWGKCLRKGGKPSGPTSTAEKDYSFKFGPQPERDYTRGLPGF